MAYRLLSAVAVLVIGASSVVVSGVSAQDYRTHPGQVLEFETRNPVSAAVKAWAMSRRTGRDGICSLYGDSPLDSRTSDSRGSFAVDIPNEQQTYTMTYCASGYVPRDDRDIPNEDDGTPVIPTPVFVLRDDGQQSAAFESAIRRRIIAFMNDLAYFRTVDSERFDSAIEILAGDVASSAEERSGLIFALNEILQTWGEQ